MQLTAEALIDSSSLMLLAGVVLVVTMLIISTRRRSADRGSSPKAYAREQIARLREQDEIRSDLKQLMMHLEELSRDINAQCDVRFAKLEKVIADADARIMELRRLGIGQGETGTAEAPDDAAAPAKSITAPPAESMLEADDVTPAAEPAEQDASRQRILELAAAGTPPTEIARQLGRDVGEVELIINLGRQDGTS